MSTKEIIKKVKEKDIVFIWILVVVVTILFLFIVLTVNEKGSHQGEAVASMSQYSSLASEDIKIGNIESEQKEKNGFETDTSGKKYYLDGELVCNGWISDNDHRYFADRNGKICTGKYIIDDTVYIFDDDGALFEGWLRHDGHWYYMTEDGAYTGYQSINDDGIDRECYFDSDGHLVEDDITPDGRVADENGYLQDAADPTGGLSGFDFSLNENIAPGDLSGISISGMPAEFYMLSIAGETSGGSIIMGDRGRAYGLCQFDYRYDLTDFMKWAYQKHPSLWKGFENYRSYGHGDDALISNNGIIDAFENARNINYEAAISDELEYMRILYWDSLSAKMNAAGFRLSERHIAVSAALFSVSVNCGTYPDVFIQNLSPDMSDVAMICGIYKIRNSILASMKVGRVEKGTNMRFKQAEPQLALDLLHGYTTIDSHKNYGGGVQWSGNIFTGAVRTTEILGQSTEWAESIAEETMTESEVATGSEIAVPASSTSTSTEESSDISVNGENAEAGAVEGTEDETELATIGPTVPDTEEAAEGTESMAVNAAT